MEKAPNNVYALMTLTDWLGLGLSVLLFILLMAAYWYAFSPKRKKELESHKFIVFDERGEQWKKKMTP
jgi:cbb3-type cytochrome oxidase subunit 3